MQNKESRFLLHEQAHPQIYVFSDKHEPEWLKVGYTERKNPEVRIREQFSTRLQFDPNAFVFHHSESAIRHDGTVFGDTAVRDVLKANGISIRGEFCKTNLETVKAAILSLKTGMAFNRNRYLDFSMRPEQAEAVAITKAYFENEFRTNLVDAPAFLWNCKMRFGKTFTAYQLALAMKFTKVLVLTYKPAVRTAWQDDLETHVDFDGWQFSSRNTLLLEDIDPSKPYVAFASYQDLLGTTDTGEIKEHNKLIHSTKWDLIIVDEYHFGAWRETAKELTEGEDSEIVEEEISTQRLAIQGKCFLYLSGTPFRAIATGEFTETNIYNWTYGDEQRAKHTWVGENNPYEELPELTILTYKMPEAIQRIAKDGEYDEFDLNYFFKASGEYDKAHFEHADEVQMWLDLLRGGMTETSVDMLKMGAEKPPFPFTDKNLKKILQHIIWYLPSVASCYAMANLLKEPQNKFYHDYQVITAAGVRAGIGADALIPVRNAMNNPNPFDTKTLTLTCGKLTTGVTVNPWTGIFMLRSLKTPEGYFQSAFRVQSPWTLPTEGGKREVYKSQCYVFDFAPNRALAQIATYASKLDNRDVPDIDKIQEFIKYLPVLAYDGFAMEEVDAVGLLDIATGITTATLLAKGWNSALLLNLDNDILKSLALDETAMNAINSIEAFRATKNEKVSSIIINTTDDIKQLRTKKAAGTITPAEERRLTDEEKKYKANREIIKEKLKTLATRIPVFMYLTDFRENKLTDVIMKLEPELFIKVTGLTIEDFQLLVSLGLFNESTMNTAVYNFRRYEDASISYSGINRHEGESVGYYSMTVTEEEFKQQ